MHMEKSLQNQTTHTHPKAHPRSWYVTIRHLKSSKMFENAFLVPFVALNVPSTPFSSALQYVREIFTIPIRHPFLWKILGNGTLGVKPVCVRYDFLGHT